MARVGGEGAAKKANVKVSYVNLVDLAGSERQSKSGTTGARLKEGAAINKSLSALADVIKVLSEECQRQDRERAAALSGKGGHGHGGHPGGRKASSKRLGHRRAKRQIPYRNSKLTRILKQSLGGNAFTSILLCMSPAKCHHGESVSTIKFGVMCKSIKNNVRRNKVTDDKTLIKKYRIKMAEMRDELEQTRKEAEKQLREAVEAKKLAAEEQARAQAAAKEAAEHHAEEVQSCQVSQKTQEELELAHKEATEEHKRADALADKLKHLQSLLLGGKKGGGGGGAGGRAAAGSVRLRGRSSSVARGGVARRMTVTARPKGARRPSMAARAGVDGLIGHGHGGMGGVGGGTAGGRAGSPSFLHSQSTVDGYGRHVYKNCAYPAAQAKVRRRCLLTISGNACCVCVSIDSLFSGAGRSTARGSTRRRPRCRGWTPRARTRASRTSSAASTP